MIYDREWFGLLQAVADAPDDDGIRLVAADWLDEHGYVARAEFIRLQIAVAQHNPYADVLCGCDRCKELGRRIQELLMEHRDEFQEEALFGFARIKPCGLCNVRFDRGFPQLGFYAKPLSPEARGRQKLRGLSRADRRKIASLPEEQRVVMLKALGGDADAARQAASLLVR